MKTPVKTPEQIAASRANYDAYMAWSAACDKPVGNWSMLDYRRLAELEAAWDAAFERLCRAYGIRDW